LKITTERTRERKYKFYIYCTRFSLARGAIMKNTKKLLATAVILTFALLLGCGGNYPAPPTDSGANIDTIGNGNGEMALLPENDTTTAQTPPFHVPQEFVRGVWVTTAWQLDFPARVGMTADELQASINEMADNMLRWETTDIFFQVRSMGDAFYPSEIFPWAASLSGTQGVAPDGEFDVLRAWIDAAHARGMRLHAWVNPYRLGAPGANPRSANLLTYQFPHLIVEHANALYFCPGNPESLEIVLAGIEELARNYNLDGIHFDDRFYPSANFNDSASFAEFGGDMTLEDWRRENVNSLVRQTQAIAHAHGMIFGVSPFAIWQNSATDPRGSATNGAQSYHLMFADTLRWVENGYVDYIAPQIYWHQGHPLACFDAVFDWWLDVTADTGVMLYIGIAAYRQFEPSRFPYWQIGDTLNWQEYVTRNTDGVDGVIFFRYVSMHEWLG